MITYADATTEAETAFYWKSAVLFKCWFKGILYGVGVGRWGGGEVAGWISKA